MPIIPWLGYDCYLHLHVWPLIGLSSLIWIGDKVCVIASGVNCIKLSCLILRYYHNEEVTFDIQLKNEFQNRNYAL